ncbi:hypothetical protein [Pseudonocardia sp. ICBG1293]|uniref:hypothetical protein n=1 Tax=Pseudonocardia sp. ICBG1293 TaxID=2844382 RepID=UPI001CCC044E|nr:hypothetical protein [Pseudonocardia sp. ICBG1293]
MSSGSDDEVATIVLNRAALDDALATPPRRVERGTGRSADRRRRKNGTRRDRGPHDTTAATHAPTAPGATPVPANAGIWLAVVAVGLALVTAMLIITVTWT